MSDINNGLVDVRKAGKIRVLPFFKRIHPYYPLLLKPIVLKKLRRVAEKLPEEICLQIDSGYRTLETQKVLWNTKFAKLKKQNPLWSESKISQELQKLIYNPRDGTPPHLTGGAVDISLVDIAGEEINLSEPHKKFYIEPQLISRNISERAQNLRLLINRLMIGEGFAPDEKEYWHFSYGDIAWARYYKRELLYNTIETVPDIEYCFTKKLLYTFIRICWKFHNYVFRTETNY